MNALDLFPSCSEAVREYIDDKSGEFMLPITDVSKVRHFFFVFKVLQWRITEQGILTDIRSHGATSSDGKELAELKGLLKDKEKEINILLALMNKKKSDIKELDNTPIEQVTNQGRREMLERIVKGSEEGSETQTLTKIIASKSEGTVTPPDRDAALKHFRQQYPDFKILEENNKERLELYKQVKALGIEVNQCRDEISQLNGSTILIWSGSIKDGILQMRVERKMLNPNADGGELGLDPNEEESKERLKIEKQTYRQKYQQIVSLKREIESVEMVIKNGKKKLEVNTRIEFNLSRQTLRSGSNCPIPSSVKKQRVKLSAIP